MIYRSIYSLLFVAPLIAGAYASGVFYLAEQSVIPITLFQLALVGLVGGFILLKFLSVDSSFELYGMEKWYALFLGLIFVLSVRDLFWVSGTYFFWYQRRVSRLIICAHPRPR